MAYILFLLFVGVPIAEIAVFILVGSEIGVLATVALVVATALAGAVLVRHQGLQTLARARAEMARDRVPAGALAEGLAILAAGALLMTPGFVTDAIGFTLLVPAARRGVVAFLAARLGDRVTVVDPRGGPGARRSGGPGTVIEGEAVEIDPPPPGGRDPESPWRRG